jgi:tetratricopeptide (TPR) repeat protein
MISLFAHATRWRAERALARGRSDSALRLFRRLAARRGARPSDRLRCASMLEEQGDRAGAIHLLQVWVTEATGPELRQQLAEALMRAGRHAESAEHWAALVHDGALAPETLLQLGAAIADQGGVGRAEGLFSDSFHGSDEPALRCAAWRHYAAMAEAAGRHDTALERWKLLSAFAPLEEGDWRHVGTLAARLGDAETVREAAAQLADPDDRAALRQLLADRQQD